MDPKKKKEENGRGEEGRWGREEVIGMGEMTKDWEKNGRGRWRFTEGAQKNGFWNLFFFFLVASKQLIYLNNHRFVEQILADVVTEVVQLSHSLLLIIE